MGGAALTSYVTSGECAGRKSGGGRRLVLRNAGPEELLGEVDQLVMIDPPGCGEDHPAGTESEKCGRIKNEKIRQVATKKLHKQHPFFILFNFQSGREGMFTLAKNICTSSWKRLFNKKIQGSV